MSRRHQDRSEFEASIGPRQHGRVTRGAALALFVLAAVLGGCGSSGAGTTASPSAAATPKSSIAVPRIPAITVLADGVQGGIGLWHFDANTGWTPIAPLPNATAIGRFGGQVALVRAGSIELRGPSDFTKPGATTHPAWKSGAPLAPIVSLDRSATGTVAVACQDSASQTYGIIGSDGTATRLNPQPVSAFAPRAAWVDTNRLLVMNTDAALVSRLSVFDVEGGTLSDLTAIGGIRDFAVAGDRQTVAAATEGNVYVGTAAEWLDGAAPPSIITLGKKQVVWDLAMDSDGTHLAMLSGTVAADGSVSGIRELVYLKQLGSWTADSSTVVPFGKAVGQVWLT